MKLVGLIWELKCVKNVIILGKMKIQNYLIFFISSNNANDRDACDTEDTRNRCTKCDSDKHRILLGVSPSECKCEYGWYDDGSNELCKKCHYSWLIKSLLYNIIVALKVLMIVVIQKKMLMDASYVIVIKCED